MLYFRCDMNEHIATGHVMRCLSIAEAARDKGIEVTFILSDEYADEYIRGKGFDTIILFTKWNDLEKDIPVLFEKVSFKSGDKLIVDSYYVTKHYFEELRKRVYTVYIDDYGNEVYDIDCLICYAIYADTLNFKSRYSASTKLLLGTDYVPLRKEFKNLPKKQIRERIENLLLLCGGADPYSFLKHLLEKLDISRYNKISLICGRYNKDYEYLAAKYADNGIVKIIKSTDNMLQYMQEADLAISAAGSTLYELCAVGTPTISYVLADNQVKNAEGFDRCGVIKYAGYAEDLSIIDNITDCMIKQYEDATVRESCSVLQQKCVNGRGAELIIEGLPGCGKWLL